MSGDFEFEDTTLEAEAFEPEEFGAGESGLEDTGTGEYEFELEGFGEFESELEGEEFLGGLWKAVKRLAPKIAPILKKIAPIAGQVVGGAFGGPLGAMAGGALGSVPGRLESEGEFEAQEDTEDEMEAEAVPGLAPSSDYLVEELAGQSAESESEAEAQTLAGGTIIYILTPAPLQVRRVAPVLARRAARLTRLFRKSPRTRPLIKAIPTIARKTAATLAKKVQKGKPVTPQTAVRTMAKQTVRLLNSPKKTAATLVKNSAKRKKLRTKSVRESEAFA